MTVSTWELHTYSTFWLGPKLLKEETNCHCLAVGLLLSQSAVLDSLIKPSPCDGRYLVEQKEPVLAALITLPFLTNKPRCELWIHKSISYSGNIVFITLSWKRLTYPAWRRLKERFKGMKDKKRSGNSLFQHSFSPRIFFFLTSSGPCNKLAV